jgi:hypothetical protein
MKSRLRLATDGCKLPQQARRVEQHVPVPLLATEIEQETDDGPMTDRIFLWRNDDGLRCRWCPAGSCNFQTGPEGQGFCVVRKESNQADWPRSSSLG